MQTMIGITQKYVNYHFQMEKDVLFVMMDIIEKENIVTNVYQIVQNVIIQIPV